MKIKILVLGAAVAGLTHEQNFALECRHNVLGSPITMSECSVHATLTACLNPAAK